MGKGAIRAFRFWYDVERLCPPSCAPARWLERWAKACNAAAGSKRRVNAFAHPTISFAFAVCTASVATAQDFRGKDINLYVGSGAGGPYDAYARLVARHLGKHMPGNPAVVVQNMPGASGRRLINFMINVAPKDGSAIATIQRGVPFEPLMGESQFDLWTGC